MDERRLNKVMLDIVYWAEVHNTFLCVEICGGWFDAEMIAIKQKQREVQRIGFGCMPFGKPSFGFMMADGGGLQNRWNVQ